MTSAFPPAFSIFSAALFVNFSALTVSFFSRSPLPRIFTPSSALPTRPVSSRSARSTTVPFSNLSYSAAASGVLTVHTSAGSCSLTGTLAAADSLRSFRGALRLFQFMNSHGLCPPYSSSTLSRCETLLIAPLVAGESSSSTE